MGIPETNPNHVSINGDLPLYMPVGKAALSRIHKIAYGIIALTVTCIITSSIVSITGITMHHLPMYCVGALGTLWAIGQGYTAVHLFDLADDKGHE